MKQKTTKGRQAFYKTPEELQAAVDRYFQSIAGVPVYDKRGLPVMKRNGEQRRAGMTPPTLTGLARFLGYADRRTFSRQAKRGAEFESVVLETRLRIEDFWERALYDSDTYNGAVYMLSAGFGWGWKKAGEQEPAEMPQVRIINRAQKAGNKKPAVSENAAAHDLRIDLLN